MRHDSPSLPRGARGQSKLVWGLAALGTCSLTLTPALARPDAGAISAWLKNTQVQEENPVCSKITKTILDKVININALTLSIEKDATQPAPSIAGLLQNLAGQPYTSEAMQKKTAKLTKERQSADQLNAVLGSLGCTPVNIDEALDKEAAKSLPPGSQ